MNFTCSFVVLTFLQYVHENIQVSIIRFPSERTRKLQRRTPRIIFQRFEKSENVKEELEDA